MTRAAQDEFAVRSHRRAAAARQRGDFDAEIIPVTLPPSGEDGGASIVVRADDGIREDTTLAGLSKLKPAFVEAGTTTAGNSSQVSDGAAAVVAARRSVANKLGLRPLGVIRSYSVVGVPPDEMGVGPAFAIPEAIAAAGLTMDDMGECCPGDASSGLTWVSAPWVRECLYLDRYSPSPPTLADVFEINEAFASQVLYCVRKLGLEAELVGDTDRVNPLGGAIALGHPLGCTGARQGVCVRCSSELR